VKFCYINVVIYQTLGKIDINNCIRWTTSFNDLSLDAGTLLRGNGTINASRTHARARIVTSAAEILAVEHAASFQVAVVTVTTL
jgi:hypothetical protein